MAEFGSTLLDFVNMLVKFGWIRAKSRAEFCRHSSNGPKSADVSPNLACSGPHCRYLSNIFRIWHMQTPFRSVFGLGCIAHFWAQFRQKHMLHASPPMQRAKDIISAAARGRLREAPGSQLREILTEVDPADRIASWRACHVAGCLTAWALLHFTVSPQGAAWFPNGDHLRLDESPSDRMRTLLS